MGSPLKSPSMGLWNLLSGGLSALGSLLAYWAFTSSIRVLTLEALRFLLWFSYGTIFLMTLGVLLSFLGIDQILQSKRKLAKDYASPPLSVVVANVFGVGKYYRAMILAAVAYGLFYAAVSSIIVYRPDQNFSVDYLATIPSVVPSVCCGSFGYIPMFTVYLTEHLGLLIIPANILLMVIVASFVGLNTALAVCTYDNRPKGADIHWLGGLGAATGLFTACPTCAGLFLGNLVQAAGTLAAATVLAAYQPLFIIATFPLLFASTILMARRLRQSLYSSCAVPRTE